ncbi:MAG: substrate-binding domain-containing protein [Bacteroidales bacterium]|nr:substrate-binding domain-containing protein [Bacteroidales bacterium]
MKYLFRSALFIIIASLVLIACNSQQDTKNDPAVNGLIDTLESETDLSNLTIGYSSPSLNAPFYVVLSQYIEVYAEAYGMTFVMADGQDDIIKQITSMEDLISSGVDIVILNPLDHKALVPAVNAAAESGVPVFIVDSQIDEAADFVTSVQASNEGNGWLIGEWAVNKLSHTDIRAALISGSQGNPVGQAKRLGFFEGYTETQLMTRGSSDLNIQAQGWGNWTLLGGIEAMEDILTAHPDVNLLLAENDAMAMGALKAIEEAGKADQVLIVAYDGQKEAYELIMEGRYGATALNSPRELARLVVESVVRYKNGERQDKVVHTPAVLITKENVNRYYDPEALF